LGETVYKDPKPVRAISHSAAALVLQSQPAAETEAAARRSNAASLLNDLPGGRGIQTISVQPAARPGYLRLPLSLARGLAGFARPAEAVRLGIAPGYPTTLAEVAAVRERMGGVRSAWPGGEELCRRLVTLPTHTRLSAADRAKVLRQLDTYGG
jgi:dTDP-4-amino-4,6-dideoxygalactose transaminase